MCNGIAVLLRIFPFDNLPHRRRDVVSRDSAVA